MSKKYYHGGPNGREIGDWILPPCKTGVKSSADYPIEGAEIIRRDKVYVATDQAAAVLFACSWPDGVVYEVRPVNLSPDPDCALAGLSYECDKALVLSKNVLSFSELELAREALLGTI